MQSAAAAAEFGQNSDFLLGYPPARSAENACSTGLPSRWRCLSPYSPRRFCPTLGDQVEIQPVAGVQALLWSTWRSPPCKGGSRRQNHPFYLAEEPKSSILASQILLIFHTSLQICSSYSCFLPNRQFWRCWATCEIWHSILSAAAGS